MISGGPRVFLPIAQVMSPDVDPEDDDISSYGPPPDPSLRSWRHPSELAAERAASQAAATNGSCEISGLDNVISLNTIPTSSNSGGTRRVLSLTVGAAAALAVCLGGLALQTNSSGELTSGVLATSNTEIIALDAGTGQVTPKSYPEQAIEVDAGAISSSLDSASTTMLLEVPPTAGQMAEVTTSLLSEEPADELATSGIEPVADGADAGDTSSPEGVIALYLGTDHVPLANGVIIEDLVLASASSLSGVEQVFVPTEVLQTGSEAAETNVQWIEFTVVASDLYSDIAVLTPTGAIALTPVVTTPGGPVAIPGQAVAVVGGHQYQTDEASSAGTSNTEIDASVGELVGTNQRTTTKSGYEIIGGLLTTCRNTDLLAGSALVDEEGFALGIIVNSQDQLATAIPLEIAIEIGRSLSEDGWRGGGWIGVRGQTVAEGIKIHEVNADGPSAAAGILPGDLITRVDDNPLSDLAELLHTLRTFASGDVMTVQIERTNQQTGEVETLILEVQLADKQLPEPLRDN